MERLTEKQSSGYDLKAMNGEWCNKYCEKQIAQTCNECVIYQAIHKLAEYEDFEEKLNGVSAKQVVDGFIKTVENQTNEEYERGCILTNAEADKWNEYKQLDKQGLLLRLPCKIGDTVYSVTRDFISEYTICSIEKYNEGLIFNWRCKEGIYVDSIGFKECEIGKTVFLTQTEAEQKLNEMESDYNDKN